MIVVLCVGIALLFVTPGWRRVTVRRRVRSAAVDQAVILDMAASALKAGVAIPAMLKALHTAFADSAILVPNTEQKAAIRAGDTQGAAGAWYAVAEEQADYENAGPGHAIRAAFSGRQTKSGRLRHAHRASKQRYRSLDEVGNMLLMGALWEEAWEHVAPTYMRLGAALAPAWNDGAAPVALLERAAQGLRYSRARRAKEAAARLGSALVVPLAACYLPAFMLLGVLPVVVAAAAKLF